MLNNMGLKYTSVKNREQSIGTGYIHSALYFLSEIKRHSFSVHAALYLKQIEFKNIYVNKVVMVIDCMTSIEGWR